MTDTELSNALSALLMGQATILRLMCKKKLSNADIANVWDFAMELENYGRILMTVSEMNDDSDA